MKSLTIFLFFFFIVLPVMANDDEIIEYLQNAAHTLEYPADLDPLIDATGNRQFVLLGEASHGTSEYYTWRAEISKRLIQEKDFRFIAVEGDWTSAYEVTKYIKDLPGASGNVDEVLANFDRWPPWMWNNQEVKELVKWLRAYNMNLPEDERVGFYGIDVYGMWDSMHSVVEYFDTYYNEYAEQVHQAYDCMFAFDDNPQAYAAAVYQGRADCQNEVEEVVSLLRENKERFRADDERQYFNAKQNALVVKHAELHYRAMPERGPDSWNHRVRNFKNTIVRLSEFYDGNGKGVVWAHNTHVGDARATPMANQGMENIGYLMRDRFGPQNVFIVGFGTHRGRVLAGSEWGAPMEDMEVPEAMSNSFGDLFYRAGISNALFVFDADVPEALSEPRGHRAKGVVYNPLQERGNYVPTVLPDRYNAFIFIEETGPLTPLF